ncbi:mutator type transposase, partial [Tanacetum coccineum]
MNNFRFTTDPKHDTSIGGVDVQDDDLDVIDYDLFGSDLDDGIDSERRMQLRELRRIDHVIKSLATNLDIPVRAVQDQMQKQFEVGVSKMKDFKAKRIASDIMTGSPWPCQILTAVKVDANNGIYPVAYAIVEAESKASWCWFLNLLGEDFGIEANFNYTFIFDRKKGLIQAIASVFPCAEHRYCVRYIHENIKSQFKGGVYKEMLWNAAKATSEGEFKKKMGELKSFNFDAYDWLMKIPLEQWSRAYFSGRPGYDHYLFGIYQRVVDEQDCGSSESFLYQVTGPYKDQYAVNMDRRWELVYLNNGFLLLTDLKHRHMYTHSRPPKKRKKSNDEIASESASSGKLSRKGKVASAVGDGGDDVGAVEIEVAVVG